jgi:hypothetical protein
MDARYESESRSLPADLSIDPEMPIVQQAIAQLLKLEESMSSGGTERLIPHPPTPQHFHLRTELVDDFLEVLDVGELFANRLGKLACDPICGDANWLVEVLQSVLHHWAAPALAKKEADRGSIEGRPHGSIDRRKIEAQFAGILRLELSSFQFNHEIAVQTDVVKEQVYAERVIVDDQRYLAANKGETAAKLKQQIAKVEEKASFQLALGKRVSQGQKIEVVRIAQDLLRHI